MIKYLLFLTLPLYILDQVSKEWIARTMLEGESFAVIAGFFDIVRVHNTGMAFGRFNGSEYANIAFSLIAISALTFIVVLWKRGAFPNAASKVAGALLISGILGNFTDRLARGYVVDFLSFDLKFMIWPSFNVADSCICVAAGLLVLSAFLQPSGDKEESEGKDGGTGQKPKPSSTATPDS